MDNTGISDRNWKVPTGFNDKNFTDQSDEDEDTNKKIYLTITKHEQCTRHWSKFSTLTHLILKTALRNKY